MDYLFLMIGYEWQRRYYLMADSNEQAFHIAETMTSPDMPSEFELTTLDDGNKSVYAKLFNGAMATYEDFYKYYGRRSKKRKR